MSDFSALLGAIQSPKDERDYNIAATYSLEQEAIVLPKFHSAQPVPPDLNQGKTPRCVGYSTTGMRLQQQRKDLNVWLALDPDWLYFECKKIDGIPSEGSTLRAAMRVLRGKGQAIKNGGPGAVPKNKVSAYYTVGQTVDDIKRAVFVHGRIVLAMPWYSSWFRPGDRGVLPAPDRQAGGHAIQCAGWDDNRGLLLANTWGRDWPGSINGNCFLPYEYVNPDFLWEAWRTVDAQG